ncbi:MAG: AtpZ/AtpI family protein [Pontiella sp.]
MIKGDQGDKEQLTEKRRSGGAIGFGSSFAAGMAIFSLGGHWIDVKFEKEPVFTLVGIFMGFVYGGWELWKLVVETNRSSVEQDQKQTSNENEGSHESTK